MIEEQSARRPEKLRETCSFLSYLTYFERVRTPENHKRISKVVAVIVAVLGIAIGALTLIGAGWLIGGELGVWLALALMAAFFSVALDVILQTTPEEQARSK